ncbi:hypothetical protein GCM10017673_38360 [Streptosporangium violaceochromogenes]|nr:hypothetical protein GCM10017673_38360 [Streptosporangium violaceochromogenes]
MTTTAAPAPPARRPLAVRWPRPTSAARSKARIASRRDVAARLAKRRLLAERLAELIAADVARLKATRPDGRPWMCPGDGEAVHLAGDRIGRVTMPETGYTLAITDADAFFAWMTDEGYGAEILWRIELTAEQFTEFLSGRPTGTADVATPSVRPAFWTLLTQAATASGGRTVHPRTGHLHPIPGLTVTATNPSPAFSKAPGVKHPVIARAARSGDLSAAEVASLLNLPTPGGS